MSAVPSSQARINQIYNEILDLQSEIIKSEKQMDELYRCREYEQEGEEGERRDFLNKCFIERLNLLRDAALGSQIPK